MSNPEERLDRVENRLDMIESLLAETVQIVQSNARSNQALADTLAESNHQQASRMDRLTDAIAQTQSQLADTDRQLKEHVARTTSAIEELSRIVGTMARTFNEHINDNERHN